MRVLNFGSLNFDRVYDVADFVSAGETVLATNYSEFLGGKGLNQSLALARAGVNVAHAGSVGPDGQPFLDILCANGVDVAPLQKVEIVSGHAIIQRSNGQNCIIVCGGANQCSSREYVDKVLSTFEAGDLLLLQNETSCVDYAIKQAKEKGMLVAINASPVTPALLEYSLEKVDYLLVNELEGKQLVSAQTEEYETILEKLAEKYPDTAIVLTLGGDGVLYRYLDQKISCDAFRVDVVDTTAAGDTFTGYFLAAMMQKSPVIDALRRASAAAALAVSKAGAANSIPQIDEVLHFLGSLEEKSC